jgi:hypothetical protein
VVLCAAILSALIETAQLLVIAGRDPSIGDVLFNTLGAAVGCGLAGTAATWLTPTPGGAARLAWIWSAVIAATIVGTGLLLAPALTRDTYYGGWTLKLGHLAWYDGRVLEASLASSPFPHGRVDDSYRAREALLAGAPLRVRAIAGARPSGLAPLVMLNDERQRAIMLLGIDRADLVFQYRTRSTALRLRQPDLRAVDAMRDIAPGDSFSVAAWREAGAYCLQRDADRYCGVGYAPSRGWGILLYLERLPSWLMRSLDAVWIGALFFPLGFWIRSTPRAALTVIPAATALALSPAVTGLLPSSFVELAAALLGLVAGHGLARWIAARSTPGAANGPPPERYSREWDHMRK